MNQTGQATVRPGATAALRILQTRTARFFAEGNHVLRGKAGLRLGTGLGFPGENGWDVELMYSLRVYSVWWSSCEPQVGAAGCFFDGFGFETRDNDALPNPRLLGCFGTVLWGVCRLFSG